MQLKQTVLLILILCIASYVSAAEKRRIISLAPHITEVLFAVGAGDEIIGAVSYSDFPAAAEEIPRVGSYEKINYEVVISLQPTLVIGWDSGTGTDSLERLRNLGLQVYSHDPKTLEDVGDSLKIFGEITGHAEQGAQQSREFYERLSALRSKYEGRTQVSLYYQLWNEPQMTVNDHHLISDVIKLCGGANIFADAIPMIPKVSIETILLRNPEVIIATGMAEERPLWLDDWRDWASLSAAQNSHLYHIHPDLLHRHAPRILDGAAQLCALLDKAR